MGRTVAIGIQRYNQIVENNYHGFVLGLLVDLAERYTLTLNRESGFGRYDVMLDS